MLRYFTYSDENRAFYGFHPKNERVFPQPAKTGQKENLLVHETFP
jgi:hypothetical protein